MRENEFGFTVDNIHWKYLPNNYEDSATFDGEPLPSKTALELVGESGIKKIDEILKGVKRIKEIIYGKNSSKIGFDPLQYFLQTDAKDINLNDLPKIFKSTPFLICCNTLGRSFFHPDAKRLKKENWDIIKGQALKYHDYAIYTLEDIYPVFFNGRRLNQTWEDIQAGDPKAIEKIKGNKKLSDLHSSFFLP